jgi:energy-coupling factor transport system ATP-binding protein
MNYKLEIQDLCYSYPAYHSGIKHEVFNKLNLQIDEGTINIILGKPEAGKTTLARIIAGLIPSATGGTFSGRILLDGRNITSEKACNLIEQLGLVFQDPEEQLISTRADTEAAFSMEALGLDRKLMSEKISKAFSLMGISSLAEKNPAGFSGGEKKKVLISSVLALNPELWILDESFDELDIKTRGKLIEHIRNENITAVIFSSKYSALYEGSSTRYFLLKNGRAGRLDSSYKKILETEGFLFKNRQIHPRLNYGDGGVKEELLKITELYFSRPDRAFTLKIDKLTLYKNEICAIIGKNGSGKTTLAKLLCGLLKAQEGSIESCGLQDNKQVCSYMFQNPDYQIFLPTVKEELSYGVPPSRLKSEDFQEELKKLQEAFQLPDSSVPPALLSFGTRKKLQAASCAVQLRPLIILDEPDSGISFEELEDMITELKKSFSSLIMISHETSAAIGLCSRIIILDEGRIMADLDMNTFSKTETEKLLSGMELI